MKARLIHTLQATLFMVAFFLAQAYVGGHV